MTKQMRNNWIWATTTGIIGAIAFTKLVILFNEYGVL